MLPVLSDSKQTQIKSVAFQFTRHCPLECGHCYINASPIQNIVLPLNDILKAIKALSLIEPNAEIAFTGGDPFSKIDVLRASCNYAKKHNFKVTINTSGFFAHDEKIALDTLRSVEFDCLEVSYDRFHSRFLNLDLVANCIRAGQALGKHIELHTLACDYDANRLGIKSLTEELHVKVHKSKLIKSKGGRLDELQYSNNTPCTFAHRIVVDEVGDVFPCCNARLIGSTIGTSDKSDYLAGNIFERTAYDLFRSIKYDKALSLISKCGTGIAAQTLGIESNNSYCKTCSDCRKQSNEIPDALITSVNALV